MDMIQKNQNQSKGKLVNIQQALAAIDTLVKGLPTLFSNVEVNYSFGEENLRIGDWSMSGRSGMLFVGDDIGNKSGVYFFCSPSGDILYIGKATKDNLHHRVWDHLRTPAMVADGKRTFPKHQFTGKDVVEHLSSIQNGDARLCVITVSEPKVVSLIEVYLQTQHIVEHQALPALNKQIG